VDAIVAFFEKLVSEFSWKRVGLIVVFVVLALAGFWGYEAVTGQFRSARMQFAADHLAKLADPELKKNVQGDEELEKAHNRMKTELNRFLETSQFDFGVPELMLKGLAAAFPWFLLGVIMVLVASPGERGSVISGMLALTILFVIIGVLLPTFEAAWINYFGYPFGSVLILMVTILVWQRLKKTPANARGDFGAKQWLQQSGQATDGSSSFRVPTA
jgi:hypothetical protein